MNACSLNILVVEDHGDTRDVLGILVVMLGHRCETACDAEAALVSAAKGTFDVLLTDIHLPGMDGWQLLEELGGRGHLPRRVISMSAGIPHEGAARSRAAGCHAHLGKPFLVETLEAALASGHAEPGSAGGGMIWA